MAIDSSAPASLAPGFRFHPTDEELVRYYLRRKICGKSFRFDAISDVDIYKVEPWDLPDRSRLKTRDLEWYFFSVLDKKYGNGSRTNRATDRGYWKTTGKDRPVYHRTQMVGMKKTLVYHSGRAPRGERTNWVMHEYRLIDEELEKAGILQDAFVLCRIFRKSGSGPKNGEQYGAPFVEEEWEDDELAMVPKQEYAEEATVDDDAYLDANDIEQILGADIPTEVEPLPPSFCYGDDGNGVEVLTDVIEDPQVFLTGTSENQPGTEQTHNPMLFDLPAQNELDATAVKREYIGEANNNANSVELDYLLDQPFLNASDNPSLEDGSFLEANDLNNDVEADPGFDMLEEYLTYFDATADNLPYTFDSSIASEDLVSDTAHEYLNGGNQQWSSESKPFLGESSKDATSSSKQEPELFGSDTNYPFLKQATRMLGNIPAPPAFASEFPSKEAALHLAAASHSSKAIHVTAGMIRIRNVTLSGNGLDMSFGKHGQVNIVLSFNLGDSREVDKVNLAANSAVSRSWLYSIFFFILILSMSFKLGSFFCARSFMS